MFKGAGLVAIAVSVTLCGVNSAARAGVVDVTETSAFRVPAPHLLRRL